MKLKYIGDLPLTSVQKSFTPNSDEIHELSLEDGNYLLNTFPKLFEKTEDKKDSENTSEQATEKKREVEF